MDDVQSDAIAEDAPYNLGEGQGQTGQIPHNQAPSHTPSGDTNSNTSTVAPDDGVQTANATGTSNQSISIARTAKRKDTPEPLGAPPAKKAKVGAPPVSPGAGSSSQDLYSQLAALHAQIRTIDQKMEDKVKLRASGGFARNTYNQQPTTYGQYNQGYGVAQQQSPAYGAQSYGQPYPNGAERGYPKRRPKPNSYYSAYEADSMGLDDDGMGSVDITMDTTHTTQITATTTPTTKRKGPSLKFSHPPPAADYSQPTYDEYPPAMSPTTHHDDYSRATPRADTYAPPPATHTTPTTYDTTYTTPRTSSSTKRGRQSRSRTSTTSTNPNRTLLPHQIPNPNKRPCPPGTPEPLKYCMSLVDELMSHHMAWPFNQPVDPVALGIPDYFDIIKHPMDLSTVRKKLEEGQYKNVQEYTEDVRLIWTNALTYNEAGSDVALMAETLSIYFEERIPRAFELEQQTSPEEIAKQQQQQAELRENIRLLREAMQQITLELQEIRRQGIMNVQNNGVQGFVKPKPRPRKIDKRYYRPMTYEEKCWLSDAIDSLGPQYLSGVMSIVQEELPDSLNTDAEEIELDIDTLDPVLLRRLESYVKTIVKKDASVSKKAPPPVAQSPATTSSAAPTKSGTSQSSKRKSSGSSSKKKSSGTPTGTPFKQSEDAGSMPNTATLAQQAEESSSSDSDSTSDSDDSDSESDHMNSNTDLRDENVTVDIVAIEDQKPDITSTQNDVTQVDQTQNKPSDMMDTSGVDEHIEITESKPAELVLKNVESWSTTAADDTDNTMAADSTAAQQTTSDSSEEKGSDTSALWSQLKTKGIQKQQKEKDRQEQEEKLLREKEEREREARLEEERRRKMEEELERKRKEEESKTQLQQIEQRREAERRARLEKASQAGLDLTLQSRIMNTFEQGMQVDIDTKPFPSGE